METEEYAETWLNCTINFENDGSIDSLQNVEEQLPEGFIKTCQQAIQDAMSFRSDYDMGVEFVGAGLYDDNENPPEELDLGVSFTTDNKSVSNTTLNEIEDIVSEELDMKVQYVSVTAQAEIIREKQS